MQASLARSSGVCTRVGHELRPGKSGQGESRGLSSRDRALVPCHGDKPRGLHSKLALTRQIEFAIPSSSEMYRNSMEAIHETNSGLLDDDGDAAGHRRGGKCSVSINDLIAGGSGGGLRTAVALGALHSEHTTLLAARASVSAAAGVSFVGRNGAISP